MNVVVICSDYREANLRLQPWRFMSEIADGLRRHGHAVTVVTDVPASEAVPGCVSVRSTRLSRVASPQLEHAIDSAEPDVCLWNFGLTSAWHFAPERVRWPSIAVFTSPVYTARDLLRLGASRLWLARDQALAHMAGATVPGKRLRHALGAFRAIIVQTETTHRELTSRGVRSDRLYVVRPGVDDAFGHPLASPTAQQGSLVLGYMGSPLPIRGVLDLVDAVALARTWGVDAKLRVLSRTRGEHERHERRLRQRIRRLGLGDAVTVRSEFMERADLVAELSGIDVLALPFQLVPSDAPLAILEGMAVGRPILGTRVACIAEYLGEGRGYLADPANPRKLAEAVVEALSDTEERSRVRKRALAHAGNFASWPGVVDQVVEIVGLHTEAPR